MRNATLIAITTISILTSACSSTPIGAVSYQDHQLQSLGTVAEGTILQIRGVSASRQDALSNGSGSVLGGIVGAVVGQSASKGRGKLLTTRVRHQNADFAFLVKPLPCESTTYAHFCGSFVVATA